MSHEVLVEHMVTAQEWLGGTEGDDKAETTMISYNEPQPATWVRGTVYKSESSKEKLFFFPFWTGFCASWPGSQPLSLPNIQPQWFLISIENVIMHLFTFDHSITCHILMPKFDF